MLILALAAALTLQPTPDLVKPGEDAAFVGEVTQAALKLAAARNGATCPAGVAVAFNGARPIGTAGVLLHAKTTDPVAPEAPVYEQKVHVRGCGEQARWDNILIMRKMAGGWFLLPTVPGDTLASPQLVHDTLRMAVAFATAGSATPGSACANGKKAYELVDTVLVTPAPKPNTLASWQERWIQRSCGDDRTVLVTFTSTADGGADYVVKPVWASAQPKP